MGDQIQKTYQADGPGKLTLKLERSDISIDTHDEPYLHVAISRIGDGGDTLEDDVIVTESQTDNDISLVMRLKEETKRRLENMMTPILLVLKHWGPLEKCVVIGWCVCVCVISKIPLYDHLLIGSGIKCFSCFFDMPG